MSLPIARSKWTLWGGLGGVLLTLAAVLIAAGAGASMPYNPLFEFIGISNSAPGANADITFRGTSPAGHHVIGLISFEAADNSWTIAGHSNQLEGDVTAVGTMTINLDPDGNCNDGDTGSPQNYGPFALRDVTPPEAQYAIWGGTITDFGDGNPGTNWPITFEVTQAPYTVLGSLTSVILPAGHFVCTPHIFTFTMCGRSNPSPTATTCGADNVVMTNPSPAGCYFWNIHSEDESGQHSADSQIGVPIGAASCPTPTPSPTATASPTPTATATASPTPSPTPTPPPGDNDGDGVPNASDNCPWWWNPTQVLPPWPVGANDPDCDSFSTIVETSAGTNPLVQCGYNAWPPDIDNSTFVDIISDVGPVSANFAKSVPPAPARHDLSPDPPNGVVDIFDISEVTTFFPKTCAPCPGDFDCDVVPNASDNCPNWSNPTQALPPWFVPPNDPDCDGFTSTVETSAGTNPLVQCGPNAWPPDIDNSTFVDIIGDVGPVSANFNKSVPPAPARHDLSPDPPNGIVDIFDIGEVTAFFPKSCS
jgi:Thrombospondin type 3 repeat